jgi:hypothetical protein
MRRIATLSAAAALLAATVVPSAGAGAATTAPLKVRVVAGRLNAPKHLTFGPKGLYVVESGSGGPVGPTNCVTAPSTGGPPTKYCEGTTGAVALLRAHHVTELTGLPSVIQELTGEVSGPGAVAFNPNGASAVVVQDVLVNPHGGTGLPEPLGAGFGKVLIKTGSKVTVVDIARFEATHLQSPSSLGDSPGETAYDSDPYDVVSYGSGFVVADAAANALLQVSKSGHITLLARFPYRSEVVPAGAIGNPTAITLQAQAVPTSVAVGPDGALYVGLLRGVPSAPGTAQIYRVVPGPAPTGWARGLTAVTALAFDGHGRLLATEYSQGGLLAPPSVPGALVRISGHGRVVTVLPVSGLFQPTGVAVGPHGTIFISNYGGDLADAAHPGEVLAITGLS